MNMKTQKENNLWFNGVNQESNKIKRMAKRKIRNARKLAHKNRMINR